jgi:hypothetical protein
MVAGRIKATPGETTVWMIVAAALATTEGMLTGTIALAVPSNVEATLVMMADMPIRSTEGTMIARMDVAVTAEVAILQEKGIGTITVKGVTRAMAIAEMTAGISATIVAKTETSPAVERRLVWMRLRRRFQYLEIMHFPIVHKVMPLMLLMPAF